MPASGAVPTPWPFGAPPRARAAAVSGAIRTTARATARRSVTCLSPTSTIRAFPASSMCVSSSGRLVDALRRGDEVAHGLLIALPEQLDRVGVAVHDRLEEDLAVLIGGQRALGPAAHLVEQHREPRIGLAVLVGDLVADALGERRRRAGRGDGNRERAGAD